MSLLTFLSITDLILLPIIVRRIYMYKSARDNERSRLPDVKLAR